MGEYFWPRVNRVREVRIPSFYVSVGVRVGVVGWARLPLRLLIPSCSLDSLYFLESLHSRVGAFWFVSTGWTSLRDVLVGCERLSLSIYPGARIMSNGQNHSKDLDLIDLTDQDLSHVHEGAKICRTALSIVMRNDVMCLDCSPSCLGEGEQRKSNSKMIKVDRGPSVRRVMPLRSLHNCLDYLVVFFELPEGSQVGLEKPDLGGKNRSVAAG